MKASHKRAALLKSCDGCQLEGCTWFHPPAEPFGHKPGCERGKGPKP